MHQTQFAKIRQALNLAHHRLIVHARAGTAASKDQEALFAVQDALQIVADLEGVPGAKR